MILAFHYLITQSMNILNDHGDITHHAGLPQSYTATSKFLPFSLDTHSCLALLMETPHCSACPYQHIIPCIHLQHWLSIRSITRQMENTPVYFYGALLSPHLTLRSRTMHIHTPISFASISLVSPITQPSLPNPPPSTFLSSNSS